MYIDPYYIMLVVPAIILAMAAQARVSSTFSKYSKVFSRRGITGAEVAERILMLHGISDVRIEHVSGNLTDHFDPRTNVIRLSDNVHGSSSVAAIGVAAHETGHAVQHHMGYVPIKIRNLFVPVAILGSYLAFPLVILGLIMSFDPLVNIGILLFSAVVLFQLVTLPVEFNASRRAVAVLEDQNLLDLEEVKGAKKVLSAAAMTYVAAAAVAIANLLRLVFLSRRND